MPGREERMENGQGQRPSGRLGGLHEDRGALLVADGVARLQVRDMDPHQLLIVLQVVSLMALWGWVVESSPSLSVAALPGPRKRALSAVEMLGCTAGSIDQTTSTNFGMSRAQTAQVGRCW